MSRPRRSQRHRAGFVVILAAFALALPLSVSPQSITVEEAVERALAQSSALRRSELRIASLLLREVEVLESTRPSLSIVTNPAYGLVTQRIAGFNPPLVLVPVEPSTLIINSTSVGVSVTQPLPTTGVVSGSLRGGFSVAADRPDSGSVSRTYSFEPSVSLSISQPLFVDGKLIDTEQPGLIYEQAQRATRELAISGDLVRRGVTATVVALYIQLDTLRRAATLQDAQRELLVGQLEGAEIRRRSGQGSLEDELALQVQINRVDDVRLQTSLAVNELEFELTNLTGLPFSSDTELEAVAELSARAENVLAVTIAGVTLEQRARDEVLQRAGTDLRLARKQAQATANAALSLTPRYADERAREDELWGSIADYFDDGAGVDLALSIGITVPLGETAARERAIRQAEIAVDIAREDAQSATEDAGNQRRLFEIRIDNLLDRIELLRFELEFEQSLLKTELELVEGGVSTDADVATIRSDILEAEIELEDLAAQLLLARLDLAAARGLAIVTVVAQAD